MFRAASPARCIRKATGFGWRRRWAGPRSCSFWPARCYSLGAAFPCAKGPTSASVMPRFVGGAAFRAARFRRRFRSSLRHFLAGTLLLGLAQFRPLPSPPRRWPPILFRLRRSAARGRQSGLVFWLAQRSAGCPGRLGVENAKQAATIANRGHRFAEAISLLDRGLEWAPLDWQLYFLRALARIGLREPPARALDDFRRARFLEPTPTNCRSRKAKPGSAGNRLSPSPRGAKPCSAGERMRPGFMP